MSKKNNNNNKVANASEKGGGLKPEELDRIVLAYLNKKGYTATKDALRREAQGVSLDELAFQSKLESETDVSSHILYFNTVENDPSHYAQSYENLKDWVNGSLDLYKLELSLVLYPIFVHCLLGLVGKGFSAEAQQFIENYGKDHLSQHRADMSALASVTLPHHIKENTISKNFIANKYAIEMCTTSYELLTSFLHDKKLVMLLGMLNQHLSVTVFSGKPIEDENKLNRNHLIGDTFEEMQEREQTQVLWGLLEDNPTEPAETPQPSETDNKNKNRKGGSNKSEVVNKNPNAPALDRIPLLPMTDQEINRRIKALKEISERVQLSESSLPSTCMYTFFNTSDRMNCMDISEDSTLMATGFADSHIRIWSLTGKPLYNIKALDDLGDAEGKEFLDYDFIVDKQSGSSSKTLLGHCGPVYGAKFSPDNKFVISCGEDSTARLWSLDTYTNLVCYKGHNYPVWDVDFSSRGSYFATASHDRTARLWSTQHIYPLRIFAGHLQDVDCVKFHPNSNYVVTGSSDKTCRMWDVQSGNCVRLFTGHTGPICALSISPDGKYLASAGEDQVINIWDLASGKKFGSYGGHESCIYHLEFSGDGTMLASTSQDNTLRLWDFNGLATIPRPPSLQLGVYPTKSTPVMYCKFTRKNVLLSGGCFTPKS